MISDRPKYRFWTPHLFPKGRDSVLCPAVCGNKCAILSYRLTYGRLTSTEASLKAVPSPCGWRELFSIEPGALLLPRGPPAFIKYAEYLAKSDWLRHLESHLLVLLPFPPWFFSPDSLKVKVKKERSARRPIRSSGLSVSAQITCPALTSDNRSCRLGNESSSSSQLAPCLGYWQPLFNDVSRALLKQRTFYSSTFCVFL